MMGNSGVSLFVILAVSVNCLCCLMVVSAWELGMSVEKVMTLLAEIQERAGGGVGRPGSGRGARSWARPTTASWARSPGDVKRVRWLLLHMISSLVGMTVGRAGCVAMRVKKSLWSVVGISSSTWVQPSIVGVTSRGSYFSSSMSISDCEFVDRSFL